MTKTKNLPNSILSTSLGDKSLGQEGNEILEFENQFQQQDTSISVGEDYLELMRRLHAAICEASEANWDGYSALALKPAAIPYALALLAQLPSEIPLPEVAVDNDGDIALEWDYGVRQILSIRVAAQGLLSYARLIGHRSSYGQEYLLDSFSRSLLTSISETVGENLAFN